MPDRYTNAIKGLKALAKAGDDVPPPPPQWAVQGLPRATLPPPVSLANKERMLAESMEKRRMYHGTRPKPQVLHGQTGTSQPLTEYDWQGNVVTAKPMPPIPEEGLTSLMPSQRRGLIFTTPDPEFASSYASGVSLSPLEGGQVYPVRVHTKNPFDYENPEHVKAVVDAMKYGKQAAPTSMPHRATKEEMLDALSTGDWAYIEDPEVLSAIRRLGFDGAYMRESNTKNLGVFRPEQVKSDIGNIGTYDVTNPDMTKRQGGGVHMQAGGALKAMQAIAKAAESAGQKAPVTANKSLVGLQDFHTSLMDNVRARAKVAQDQMDSWDYKYAPGQYVFTEHGAKNNLPPLKILEKSRSGWNIVREDPNNPLSKKVIDPETGKAMRTPYEPGYRVRREISPDDWSEFVIPESAIKGSVSEAKGGAIRMQVGGLSRLAKLATAGEEVAPVVKRGFSPRLLESTTSKMMDELLAANPKLTPEEALRKASTQAEKKLTWEREQKPALVKQYGPLARAPYDKSNPQKMQNTRETVQKRIQKANEFLDQPTEPWTPPPAELQAFDRSAIKDALEGFPGIEQTAFPRDIPTRASTSHVEELYSDPVNRELIKKQIKRGLPLGGETFYASLYPIKQAVLEAGMPAEKFDQWIYSLAPASARNSIINETAVGQFLRDMNARGIPLTEENVAREMAAYKQKFGVGLPLMPIHRQGVANVLEGGQDLREMNKANIPTNYKIPTYGTQKAGDFGKSVVLDVHEAAGQTQGSRYHPYFKEQGGFGNTEYNVGEQGMMSIADELGIPGGMAQAGRWFGGGELTGLKSPRGDALDILEKQVAYTLKQQGKQPNPANIRAEILRQIQTGEGQLLPWYKGEGIPDVRETGLQRKDGGSVNESFTQRLSSALQGFAIGGEVSDNTSPDMNDGGQINYGGQYAKGGKINMPVRSLKQVKSRRYDGGGYVDPLSAPSFSVGESDLIDRAKKLISEQIAKEGAVLSTPEGRKDIALKVASTLPGLGLGGDLVDLVDLVQSLIPGLNKPASVMDTEGKGDKVAKYPLRNLIGPPTSKDFQEAFKARGWLGESEAPVTEFAGMLVAPGALAKTPRAIEGGLNRATAAARRGSTPAMLTAEAVAPDLGQFRSPEWQNYLTKKLITEEGAPVGMTTMGGQKTQKFPGQGLYVNRAGEFEANPMVGVSIPRAGNLSKNQPLLADIATAGKELGQEAMAAHRFIPMMTNQIKDATSMMVTGAGGKPLTPEQVKALAARMPEMIVSHSPQTGGLFLAPFSPAKGIQPEFLEAQKAVQEVLGKGAKIQYGRTDPTKDLLYFGDYAEKGARAPSAESQAMRKRLKSMDVVFPRKPSGSPSTSGGLNQVPANAGG